jgi:antimicrobial peptide system SdpB family protein
VREIYNFNYAIARSLFALGSLLTLVFNDIFELIPRDYFMDTLKNGNDILNLFHYFSYQNLVYAKIFAIFILFLIVLGFFPFITGFFHLIISYSLFKTIFSVEGGDQITLVISCLIFPLTVFDFRLNHFSKNFLIVFKNKKLFYFLRSVLIVVSLQTSILYFDSFIEKVHVNEWRNGTATYYWFNHNLFGAPIWLKNYIGFLFNNSLTVFSITWFVLILELMLACAIFFNNKIKGILFIIGFFFHFSIFLIHGLPTFGIAMIGTLILYLQPFSSYFSLFQIRKLLLSNVKYNLNSIKKILSA